jgi:heme/copper-type cytochrome/quinol oxidase subunit 1
MLGAIAQPTTLRAYRSSTTARYSQPLRVRMYVMSLTQAWLGPLGLKRRASTLSETRKFVTWSAVRRIDSVSIDVA